MFDSMNRGTTPGAKLSSCSNIILRDDYCRSCDGHTNIRVLHFEVNAVSWAKGVETSTSHCRLDHLVALSWYPGITVLQD